MFGTTVTGMRRDPSSSGQSIWLLEAMGIKEKMVGISIPFLETAEQFTNGIKRELMDNHFAGAPSTRPIRPNNAGAACNDGPCWEIGPRNIANQLVDTDLGVVEQGQTARL